MPKRWLAFSVCCLLLWTGCARAQDIPRPSGWVNDFADVISPEYKEKLSSLIGALEERTSAEIAVVTVRSIAPYDEREYARMLFDNWRPGKIGKDNGVLVLLALKERRWRIETGYGVEGVLPDGVCGEIGRGYMVPYFKEGEYGQGLYYGVAAIAKTIARDAGVTIENLQHINLKPRKQGLPFFLFLFIPLFFFAWNLPWPFIIGLPFTLLFAFAFSRTSLLLGILVIAGYIASLIFRYQYWHKLPKHKRGSFFGPQYYGASGSGGYGRGGGGFGGGGFGGFGGGSGGGGGGGGGF